MKFIKMKVDIDGCSMSPTDSIGIAARYVRADLFDEIIISWNGDKGDDAIYTVEGVVYDAEDEKCYDIKYCDTYEEAEAYVQKLIDQLT